MERESEVSINRNSLAFCALSDMLYIDIGYEDLEQINNTCY